MNSYTDQIKQLNLGLVDYQVDKINSQIKDFQEANKQAKDYSIKICPKCNTAHPPTIKGGTTLAGKQMLRCKLCNKRFVIDHGQLTFYSHQSQSKWNEVITETIAGRSIRHIAAMINVHEITSFRMRHKLLHALEAEDSCICTSGLNRAR